MNDFESILTRLSAQFDGQTTPAERQQLEADMAAHTDVAPMAAALRQVDGMLRHAAQVAPLHDLSAVIMARIEQEKRTPRSLVGAMIVLLGTLSLWPLLWAGAVLFLVVSTLLRPETWRFVVAFLVSAFQTMVALAAVWSTMIDVFGPWLLPVLAAMLGLAALTLALSWAKRANPDYQIASPRYDS